MDTEVTTAYDRVLYPSYTHPQTHPDRLATLATLLGMEPAPITQCRVLELGCGDGSNLVPMAYVLPGSEFVGIDLAARPVALGQQMIADLGLSNIRLVQASVEAIDASWGQFDYILAHGLYSWVPAPVRDRILAVCHANLSPQGVAYVSYNVYPGNFLRDMVRSMLLFHVRALTDPDERVRQAMAFIQFLAESRPGANPFQDFMKKELERVRGHEPGHLYHDELAEINSPSYFLDFADHARKHGLQYLTEADYFETQDKSFTPATREQLRSIAANRLLREQYLDFLKCRCFRQTLLCHREVELRLEPGPEILHRFRIASTARPPSGPVDLAAGKAVAFEAGKGARVETDLAIGKAALVALSEVSPDSLPFDTLCAGVRQRLEGVIGRPAEAEGWETDLAGFLLEIYAYGIVELHRFSPEHTTRPTVRPRASAVARWQAQRGRVISSVFHAGVRVEDELGRHLLGLLDGTRDREALVTELIAFLESKAAFSPPDLGPEARRREVAAELEKNLVKLGRLGLLVG